jgi:dTDP-4-amino-4,6-dideoxygalactose transaminase
MTSSLKFVDLGAQRLRLGSLADDAIRRVLDHGQFIMGPEVEQLEGVLGSRLAVPHVVSCASGTDALVLALLALEVRPGDAVFVPTFTFAATAEAVAVLGATPVFVDIVPDTYTMDPNSLEEAIAAIRDTALRPVGVIPVDLFGHPANYGDLARTARSHGLWVVADAAQSLGAVCCGRPVGQLADVTTTSFFPSKPLGCYGDGGAVFTTDAEVADRLRSLRVHGQGSSKYDTVRIGINGRLDTIQAAVLLAKLEVFDDELAARSRVAKAYASALGTSFEVPSVSAGCKSAWAQYTLAAPGRDRLAKALKDAGVPTAIYYPVPLHRQVAYCRYPTAPGGLAVSERRATEVLSLPMHPYLSDQHIDQVCAAALTVS